MPAAPTVIGRILAALQDRLGLSQAPSSFSPTLDIGPDTWRALGFSSNLNLNVGNTVWAITAGNNERIRIKSACHATTAGNSSFVVGVGGTTVLLRVPTGTTVENYTNLDLVLDPGDRFGMAQTGNGLDTAIDCEISYQVQRTQQITSGT